MAPRLACRGGGECNGARRRGAAAAENGWHVVQMMTAQRSFDGLLGVWKEGPDPGARVLGFSPDPLLKGATEEMRRFAVPRLCVAVLIDDFEFSTCLCWWFSP